MSEAVSKSSERPKECPHCKDGPEAFSWVTHLRSGPHAPGHNLLSVNDVECVAVLGCDTCSETLAVVPIEEMVGYFR